MASVQHPLSHQLLPGHEQQRQQQQCGGASTGTHNMLQANNYHKDVDSVDEFPAGLRVLVVDDDPICLMILERMLHQCSYQGLLLCQYWLLMCPSYL